MKKLRLEVIFGGRDKLSPALKIIANSSTAATKALKKARDEVKALNDQQKKIDGYAKQKKAVQDNANALKDLQSHIKNLRQQMSVNPSAAITKEFEKSVAKARKLKQEYEKNRIELQRMRAEMNNSRISTNRLSEHQQQLRTRLNQANQAMHEQEQRLKRMTQMQQNYQRTSGNLRSAAMYGTGAALSGVGVMYQMRKPIDETKRTDVEENRIASLGLGKEATEEAIKYARAMRTFGTSTLDNLQLVRDGVTAFADVHHAKMVAPTLAKMKFANEAMYGDTGAENEKKFMDMLKVIEMRNGLKSEKAFHEQANIIQQVITATGGRVQAEEWLNVIKTGGIAAKGIENKAFYYKLEPLVQEMGGFRVGTAMMSAYQNVYQGRTTKRAANNMARLGLIEDESKVHHDKAGQISFLDVGAIKGAALFKKDQFAWMEQVLVPQLKANGITKEGDIIDAMGSIFTNRTASNLFAQMYMQREQIHKNARLNAGADNIDQLNSKAMGTTTGKEIEAKAKLHDAYLKFGTTILPIYTKAIETATIGLQSFNGWMERNPGLAKIMGAGLLGIAASLIVIGGTLAIFSPLILGMLSLRLIMASTSASGHILSKTFSFLPTVFNIFKTSLLMAGRAFLWLGRLALANPIGMAITAIGVAAYLIYKNWEPIKAFFVSIWGVVTTTFNGAVNKISQIMSELWQPVQNAVLNMWNGVKSAFNTGIGFLKNIIQGIDNVFSANPILNLLLPFIGIPRLIIANWSSITGVISGIWTSIYTAIANALTSISSYIASSFSYMASFISGIWTGISNLISITWQVISNKINAGMNLVINWITAGFNSVSSFVSGIWNSIKNTVSTAWQRLCNIFAIISPLPYIYKSFEAIFGYLGKLGSRMMSIGRNIIDGLIVGIKSGFEKLKSLWVSINSYMPDFMRRKMDIHSPSRVMAGLGSHIMGGISVGLQRGFPDLKTQYANVMALFNPSISNLSPVINIEPVFSGALDNFNLGNLDLTQKVQIEPVLINKKFPDFKKVFSDVMGIFRPDIPDLIQKIDVAPALAKIKTAQLQPANKIGTHVTIQGDTITFKLQTQPGQSEQQIMQTVKKMLIEHERQKVQRIRNQFNDSE